MPLESGSSREAFAHNVATEMHADKPQKQALAIAYAKKRGDAGFFKDDRTDAELLGKDSFAVPALDPPRLDACITAADAIVKRVGRKDAEEKYEVRQVASGFVVTRSDGKRIRINEHDEYMSGRITTEREAIGAARRHPEKDWQ